MKKHEPEKRQKYAPESTLQKKAKNAMDVSTPSPKLISRTDAKFKNAQGENSERKRVAQLCEELGAPQSFSVKPLVARESRQTKKRRTSTTL